MPGTAAISREWDRHLEDPYEGRPPESEIGEAEVDWTFWVIDGRPDGLASEMEGMEGDTMFDDSTTGITSVATWYGETPTYQVQWDFDEVFYSFPDSIRDATIRTPWFASAEWPSPTASRPTEYALFQNYPNPFNPVTTVSYYVPSDGPVALDIYDVSGRCVISLVDRYQDRGSYAVDWNGCDEKGIPAASGVYFYRLTSGKETLIRKMILLR